MDFLVALLAHRDLFPVQRTHDRREACRLLGPHLADVADVMHLHAVLTPADEAGELELGPRAQAPLPRQAVDVRRARPERRRVLAPVGVLAEGDFAGTPAG